MYVHHTATKPVYKEAGRVALKYAIFSVSWIIITDWLVDFFFSKTGEYPWFQTIKGIIFVLASAGLICLLVYQSLLKIKKHERELELYNTQIHELLRLLRHRQKNNLALISGILEIKFSYDGFDARAGVPYIQGMLRVISICYDFIDENQVDNSLKFTPFVQKLLNEFEIAFKIETSFPEPINSNSYISFENAIHLALLLNECLYSKDASVKTKKLTLNVVVPLVRIECNFETDENEQIEKLFVNGITSPLLKNLKGKLEIQENLLILNLECLIQQNKNTGNSL